MSFFDFSNLRGDIYGGLTAGIIALPLALAFGEASGAGPIAGIWGAILVGFFASLFGGTGSNVSGPTGPMVVVFAGVFASLSGQPELIFSAVVLAGVLQIVFGMMTATGGRWQFSGPRYPFLSISCRRNSRRTGWTRPSTAPCPYSRAGACRHGWQRSPASKVVSTAS